MIFYHLSHHNEIQFVVVVKLRFKLYMYIYGNLKRNDLRIECIFNNDHIYSNKCEMMSFICYKNCNWNTLSFFHVVNLVEKKVVEIIIYGKRVGVCCTAWVSVQKHWSMWYIHNESHKLSGKKNIENVRQQSDIANEHHQNIQCHEAIPFSNTKNILYFEFIFVMVLPFIMLLLDCHSHFG